MTNKDPATTLVERMRLLEADHQPHGYPPVTMQEVSALCAEIDRMRAALTAIGLQCTADAQAGEWTTSISCVQDLVKTGLGGGEPSPDAALTKGPA